MNFFIQAQSDSILSPLRILRDSIRRFIRRLNLRARTLRSPSRIVLGSSGVPVPGWLLTDMDQLNIFMEKDWARYFECNSLKIILAEHVWEHLTSEEGRRAAELCYRYLRPGGRLRIAVPDGRHPDADYIDAVKPMGSAEGSEDHKVLYTSDSLRLLLESVGFKARLLECFDANGEFISEEWDPGDGMIRRSARFDSRNRDGQLRYTSIIIDAFKPQH